MDPGVYWYGAAGDAHTGVYWYDAPSSYPGAARVCYHANVHDDDPNTATGEQMINVPTLAANLHHVDAGGEQMINVPTLAANLHHVDAGGEQINTVVDDSISNNTLVHTVWRENCAEKFELVRDALRRPRRHLHIAVDMEFTADAATGVHHRPVTSPDCYDHVRRYANGGAIVQMGLAIAFVGDAQSFPSPPPIALEINFQLDVEAREYHPKTIKFLSDQGHDLTEHSKRGVEPHRVSDGLLRHLPFGDASVTWLAFHGDYDLAFLLRLLQSGGRSGNLLPSHLPTFLNQVREKFPMFYDVRVLGQLVKDGFTGSLTALAQHLGIQRNGGEHHAGSDALLTLSCFFKIFGGCQQHRLDARLGLLAGLEEWNMAIKCARHIDDHSTRITIIEVLQHNFHEEARRVEQLVPSNFDTIGVEVILHPQLIKRSYAVGAQKNYELMKTFLNDADSCEIIVTFINAEGMLAYGRAWKFCISYTADDNGYAHPRQFAQLMASCRATHYPAVSWVTFHGAHGVGSLIRSFLAPHALPVHWSSYIGHRRAFFPTIYDVSLIVDRCPDIMLPTTECKGDLLDVARALNLKAMEADKEAANVLLTLRCYMRLAQRPDFPNIAMAVQGLIKESCCWNGTTN
uniref:Uncharacterized protein n=1 Tax=Leersia perrieri TaxID=77586 RepID=A0A0D9XJT3_9ORYZ